MSKVMVVLGDYLNKSRPEPSLAIMDPDLSPGEMEGLGFKKQDEYWIISRGDAKKIFNSKPFDFEKHWETERRLRQDAIPQ